MDRAMLVKFMGMTMSAHDNEALTALRKANAMLLEKNLTWQEVLAASPKLSDFRVPPSQRRGQPPPQSDPEQNRYDNADEINQMFQDAFDNAHGTFRSFLHSIHEWWESKGFLTAKQYQALKRAAGR
jgi:hypothetical protein